MSDDDCAIRASYSEFQMVKTRSVLKIILEVPIERAADVLKKLGVPIPGEERHVAVALLSDLAKEPDNVVSIAKTRYAQSSPMERAVTRAGMLAHDEEFWQWSSTMDEADAAGWIRDRCGVRSRSEIATDSTAFGRFVSMEEEFRQETGRAPELRS
jgi:hypothetical protein